MRERKTLNKPLLRKLALKLRRLRHEEHYNQESVIQETACGTAACVGGWALILGGLAEGPITNQDEQRKALVKARQLLGLPSRPEVQTFGKHWLFSGCPDNYISIEERWPEPFAKRWSNRLLTKERPSRIAADLLDAIADGKVKP